MILSRRVALGGVQLDEIHERIVIRSVDTSVPHEDVQTVNRMGGWGQRLTVNHWETLEVTVNVAIDVQKREMALRREIFEAITAWAMKKGWLTVNYMVNRRLYVDKVVLPSSGDLWQWTNEFPITFRAYSVPFWQDTEEGSLTVNSITKGDRTVEVTGQMPTVMNVTLENISGQNISKANVTAGNSKILLDGLTFGGGSTLTISHGNDDRLKVRVKTGDTSSSVYTKLQTGSTDLLQVSPGTVTVSFDCSRAVKATVTWRGRYV